MLIDVFALQFEVAKYSVESATLPLALNVACVINALPPDTPPLPPLLPDACVVVEVLPLEVAMHLDAHDALSSGALVLASDGKLSAVSGLLHACSNAEAAIDNVTDSLFILFIMIFCLELFCMLWLVGNYSEDEYKYFIKNTYMSNMA